MQTVTIRKHSTLPIYTSVMAGRIWKSGRTVGDIIAATYHSHGYSVRFDTQE